MAKQFRRSGSGVQSANRKIVQVNQAQGFGNMSNMQGTTRVIYDAVRIETSANTSTYTLFENCKTRNFPLTNLTENKLQVGETMAIQRFSVFIMGCAAGTTNCTGIFPFSFFALFSRFYGGQLSFNIAQDQVIKKLPLSSMAAPFNPNSKFIGYYQSQPLAADPVTSYTVEHNIYHMDTNLVLPPQIEFNCTITVPALTTLPAVSDWYLMMKMEGIGSLYAPKTTY